jgi:hypothetical protein
MRIQLYYLIAPAFSLFLCGCGGGPSEPILQAGDYASVKSETYCMESQDALGELRSWAVRKDYDEVSRVFSLKGVAMVRIGDRAKVLDRTFGGDVKIRLSGDREYWTVMNVLRKGVAATPSAQTRRNRRQSDWHQPRFTVCVYSANSRRKQSGADDNRQMDI